MVDSFFVHLLISFQRCPPQEDQDKRTLHGGLERHADGILGHDTAEDAAAVSAALPDPATAGPPKFHTSQENKS